MKSSSLGMLYFTFKKEKNNPLSHLAVMRGTKKFDTLGQKHQSISQEIRMQNTVWSELEKSCCSTAAKQLLKISD